MRKQNTIKFGDTTRELLCDYSKLLNMENCSFLVSRNVHKKIVMTCWKAPTPEQPIERIKRLRNDCKECSEVFYSPYWINQEDYHTFEFRQIHIRNLMSKTTILILNEEDQDIFKKIEEATK